MKNFLNNYNFFFFDSIFKFNLFNKKYLLNLNFIKIFVKLQNNDNLFLRNFFILSKIFFFVFKRKVNILKIFKNNQKINKTKNSLFFFFGITINKLTEVLKILNFILNDVQISSRVTDDSLNVKRIENNIIFFFKNINYFLGLNFSTKFSN